MNQVKIEFYGIVRRRTGVSSTPVEIDSDITSLGNLLTKLALRFPKLERDCIDGERLMPGFSANLDGEQFVSDPSTPISCGSSLLIMSSDAGG